MPRIAYLISSAREIDLPGGGSRPTGFWAEQVLTSYERLMAAGADVVVMAPDGQTPIVDQRSLEPAFHFPDEDRGFFASVYRTFHRDPDDIRVTLRHLTDPELMASRRMARRLVLAGRSDAEAHELISRAAKIAWRQDRSLIEVMLTERLDGDLGEAALRAAAAELALVGEALAEDRISCLEEADGFRSPVDLAQLNDAELDDFDGLFSPGGHAALVDLPEAPRATELLRALHAKGAPIAALAQAPAVLLAAPDRLDGQWLFEGFRLTCSTNDEEGQLAEDGNEPPWYVASALQNAGAILDDGPYPWASHVVVDRNLITGQNLYSTEATVGAFLKALELG